MEGASIRPPFRMPRCGWVLQMILVCLATTALLQSSFSAATSAQSGSLKAELFHRDHPFSRMQRRGLSGKPTHHVRTHTSTTLETNITDGAVAEYLMSISLGTPPQNFVAVADTGSSLVWLQCKPCLECYNQSSPLFDPTVSSTYERLSCSSAGCAAYLRYNSSCNSSCEYLQYYGDHSMTAGYLSSETIHLTSTNGQNIAVPDFWFGCSVETTSPVDTFDSADGLVGLGRGAVSFPSQLGHVFEDKFSYCLVNRSLAGVQSSLLLFGKDAALDLALQYTPILSNPESPADPRKSPTSQFYYIGIEGISVGGAAVNYSAAAFAFDSSGNGGTIIDSGTTHTYLNTLAFDPLLDAVIAKVPSSYQRLTINSTTGDKLCYNVAGEPNYENDFPEISFKLANDTSWNLSFENAWDLFTDESATCLSIYRQTGSNSILGNIQQRDFLVLYDRVEARLGFAKTDCSAYSL